MIRIIKTGITHIGTEVIVNAANTYLREGGGVCGAIFSAAGRKQLKDACDRYGGCRTGDAVITPGFALCPYIIHAVGPVYTNGHHREPQLLYSAYRASLDLMKENGCRSIGFPLISSGIFGYPVKEAWEKALQAVHDWEEDNGDDYDIRFALIDDTVFDLGIKTAEELGIVLSD